MKLESELENGEEIAIVCKRSELDRRVSFAFIPKHETFRGAVYPRQSWQKNRASINLTTGNTSFPWREIPLHNIVSITRGNDIVKIEIQEPRVKRHKVKGSTGTIYNILESSGTFNCDCVGFKFHGYCKHIKNLNKH